MWFVRWTLIYGNGYRLDVESVCRGRAEARKFARDIRSADRERIHVSGWFLGDTAE